MNRKSVCSFVDSNQGFDIIFYCGINQDKFFLLDSIVKVAHVPVFSNNPVSLGQGVIGGLYQSGTKTGSKAAALLIDLMKSKNRDSFNHIYYTDQEYFFDQLLLDKYKIQKKKLPAGSLIINSHNIFNKTNFKVLLIGLVLLVLLVIILSVINWRRRIKQIRSNHQILMIEDQRKQLEIAQKQLSQIISELEVTNQQLYETNISLFEAKKKAEESDKLKSAFLANISHEIRTPLNSIVGFSSLLNLPNQGEDVRRRYIEVIALNSESLLELIDKIIDLSKIETQQVTFNIRNFSIDELISELMNEFEQQNQNHKVQFYTDKISLNKELFANSDRVRVKQVFSGLLSNAFKFTHSGFVEFGYCQSEKDGILLYVKDSGIGIHENDHQAIFHQFRKLNENSGKVFSGAGMGLTITQKLVELLGGDIWIDSEPDKGSTFYFTLQGLELKDISA